MANEIFGLAKVTNPEEDSERLCQFLQILDHWIPQTERDLDHVGSYWSIRWHTLSLQHKKDVAIRECRDLLEISGDSGRLILIPYLGRLLGPTANADDAAIEDQGFVLSEELTSVVLEWRQVQPFNRSCGSLMVRIASFTTGDDAINWLKQAEEVANHLFEQGNFESASSLFGSLLFGYYREHDATKAGQMKEQELRCARRSVPRVKDDAYQAIRNNGNYVQLGIALRGNAIGQDLLAEMKSLQEADRACAKPNVLYAYNYSIALAYAGQIEDALDIIKDLLRYEGYKRDLVSHETRWIFLFITARADGVQPEVEHTHVVTACYFSACQMLIALDRFSEASMWAVALIKRLKSEQEKIRDPKIWEHALRIFHDLKAKPDQWLTGKIRKEVPSLIVDINITADYVELSDPQKNNPCPCGSQLLYRNCCLELLRQ